jgi:uncharacterized membrane protein
MVAERETSKAEMIGHGLARVGPVPVITGNPARQADILRSLEGIILRLELP